MPVLTAGDEVLIRARVVRPLETGSVMVKVASSCGLQSYVSVAPSEIAGLRPGEEPLVAPA